MNERIEIVNDTEVRIARNGFKCTDFTNVRILYSSFEIINDDRVSQASWDALGRAALRDVINCLEATGSFAALADTSNIPFVGKRMRVSRSGVYRPECVVLRREEKCWFVECVTSPCGDFRATATHSRAQRNSEVSMSDLTKPFVQRGGKNVRLGVDLIHATHPKCVYQTCADGNEIAYFVTPDGFCRADKEQRPGDLINVPVELTRWLAIVEFEDGSHALHGLHCSEAIANDIANERAATYSRNPMPAVAKVTYTLPN